MDFGILGVELADKFPPCLKPILMADESNDLRRLAEPLGEGPLVAINGLGVRHLNLGQAGHVQRIVQLPCPGERLSNVFIIHGYPCQEAFRPCPEGRHIFKDLWVQILLVEDS